MKNQSEKFLYLLQNFRFLFHILHRVQGSYLLDFQNSSGFSLIVDTLKADTECKYALYTPKKNPGLLELERVSFYKLGA